MQRSLLPPFLLSIVSVLLLLGLLMVFNTTSAEMLDLSPDSDTTKALAKQLLGLVFSICIGFFIWRIGLDEWIGFSPIFFYGTTLLLVAVLIPQLGQELNGARRWISIAGISLQPSELMKISIPLHFLYLYRKIETLSSIIRVWKHFSVLLLPLVLIFFQPDNGTVVIIGCELMVICFLASIPWKMWAFPILIIGSIGVLFALQMPHVRSRIHVYLHPESDLLGKGHQPYQAKIASGSGKVFGKGFGMSLQKLHYLPEARSDYIAAIYAEEFGFLGVVFLLVLYLALATIGYCIGINSRDFSRFFIAGTYSFLLAFQAFLNLGVVSGLLPSKGTNLPLFSQGGSSLLGSIIAIALILACDRKRIEGDQRNETI